MSRPITKPMMIAASNPNRGLVRLEFATAVRAHWGFAGNFPPAIRPRHEFGIHRLRLGAFMRRSVRYERPGEDPFTK
jgi:hypothetical protein